MILLTFQVLNPKNNDLCWAQEPTEVRILYSAREVSVLFVFCS
jgi:hypothetical protein